jgi:hypothetical protein
MHIKLPQRVAFKYVTVKFLDIDNIMGELGDDHPLPNVDV